MCLVFCVGHITNLNLSYCLTVRGLYRHTVVWTGHRGYVSTYCWFIFSVIVSSYSKNLLSLYVFGELYDSRDVGRRRKNKDAMQSHLKRNVALPQDLQMINVKCPKSDLWCVFKSFILHIYECYTASHLHGWTFTQLFHPSVRLFSSTYPIQGRVCVY